MLEKLRNFLDSEEGQKSLKEYATKLNNRHIIENSQYDRFHIMFPDSDSFTGIVEKIIRKYNSDEYCNKWAKMHKESPEGLLFFLFHYAEKYGREATNDEYVTYGCMFTGDMYIIHNYVFEIIHGQGSAIRVHKLK